MKKTLCALIALLMLTLVTACGDSSSSRKPSPPDDGNPDTEHPIEEPEPPEPPLVKADGSIEVLSNRADLISGGDALIRVQTADADALQGATLRINGKDAGAMLAAQEDGALVGLVSGLTLGENTLHVRLRDNSYLERTLINHPRGGPVFSGPQVQPWHCPNSDRSQDQYCNQAPEYSFKYLPASVMDSFISKAGEYSSPQDYFSAPVDMLAMMLTGQELLDYDPEQPPKRSSIAKVTSETGVTMPFIVRVEKGVINRDRYQIMALFDPEQPWTALAPQPQWNHKLLVHHGSNVGVEYGMANPPNSDVGNSIIVALARGFVTLSNAQANLGHNANLVTGAESLMMAKEHIIEQYGLLRFTIGTGCSGGAIMQLHVANAYPGIYQGVIVQCAYPDVWTTAVQFADYHLLNKQFSWSLPSAPEDVLLMLKSLLLDPGPVPMISFYGHLPINPIVSDEAFFPGAFPTQDNCRGIQDPSILYDAETNPGGLRCGLVDWMHNQFGVRGSEVWSPAEEAISRGFTATPFDNVGVQYGLKALQLGLITGQQFLDVNRKMGGLDIDFQRQDQRSVADHDALRFAYRSGAINTFQNMNSTAIIDLRGLDPGFAHDAFHSWQFRARLEQNQDDTQNHVIWFGPVPLAGDTLYTTQALLVMNEWLNNVEASDDALTLGEKLRAYKPVQARDRCLSVSSLFDAEHLPPLLSATFTPNPPPLLDLSKIPAAPAQLGKLVDAVTNQVCGLSLEQLTNVSHLLDLPDGGALSNVLGELTRPIDQLLKPITDLQSTLVTTRFGTPRIMAGDDLTTLANKCQLKPVDPADYATAPFLSLTDPAGLAKQLANTMVEGATKPQSIPGLIKGLLPSAITNPLSVVDNLVGLFEKGIKDPTSLPTEVLNTLAMTLTPDPRDFARKVEAIFPDGVCDYSLPPVGAEPTVPWLQYGDAEQVVYGGEPLADESAPASRQGWASPNFGLALPTAH
ncbi:DUF6351 family protein [Isoalcanivorax beigongshangi]|uniref:DUF6351 family protein n=1 Tax=Isoalcanivorax beigongshangi TaxID=3238810 RepID=A0ABV4AIC9_9GAMM